MTRRKVVAWVVSLEDGADGALFADRQAAGRFAADAWQHDKTARVVKLVESDPARDAVVRAAVAWRDACLRDNNDSLLRAVERLMNGKKR